MSVRYFFCFVVQKMVENQNSGLNLLTNIICTNIIATKVNLRREKITAAAEAFFFLIRRRRIGYLKYFFYSSAAHFFSTFLAALDTCFYSWKHMSVSGNAIPFSVGHFLYATSPPILRRHLWTVPNLIKLVYYQYNKQITK